MFKPYLLPISRPIYQSNKVPNHLIPERLSTITLYATNHTTEPTNSLYQYDAHNYTLIDDPLFHIMTNPCIIFIFVSLYSIWLGGFTKRQIYDYLNQEDQK